LNKQRYLAELRRLLVFMTEEDREETVLRYSERFDEAGPGGEAELIGLLGSPTKAAISLSRGYEPGSIPDTLPPRPRAAAEEPEASAEEEKKEDPLWVDIPDFDVREAEKPAAPAEERAPDPAADIPLPKKISREEPPAPRPAEEPRPARVVLERSMPLWLGIPLFILVFAALGIPIAAVFLALMIALLVPGCAVLFAAYLVFVGGLWCTGFMADAVLLFGAAFIVLALGIFVLWAGIWLDSKLLKLYVKGVRWLAGELLGRKVTVDE